MKVHGPKCSESVVVFVLQKAYKLRAAMSLFNNKHVRDHVCVTKGEAIQLTATSEVQQCAYIVPLL
jgi:hypothetical protein